MITDSTLNAARQAARAKLAKLLPDATLADEIADAVLAAVEMPLRYDFAEWLDRYNLNLNPDYSAGVTWAIGTLRGDRN